MTEVTAFISWKLHLDISRNNLCYFYICHIGLPNCEKQLMHSGTVRAVGQLCFGNDQKE